MTVIVAGETLVDFLPEAPGRLADVETFHRRAGGAPANVAVGLARLGDPPLFWTRVGADPFGEFLRRTLVDAGLPDDYVEVDPEARTGLAFVSLGADAEREFSFHRQGSADTRLRPGAVPDDELEGADWVHVGGVTLADDPARAATLDLAERAYEAGATVSFDPNARPELWDDYDFPEAVRAACLLSDVVKATPEDLAAAGFDGADDLAAALDDLDGSGDGDAADDVPTEVRDAAASLAADVCATGPHTALVTLGGVGAVAHATAEAPWSGDGPTTVSHGGYDVDPVDTTGAGDAFTAGAVRALEGGESLAEALAFANAVAAATTTAAGAMTALPTREEVRAFRE